MSEERGGTRCAARRARALGLVLALGLCSGWAHATLFTFTNVADTSTPIPGGSGAFTSFGNVAFSGGNIAFFGRGSAGQQGIYTDIGGTLGVVADLNTSIPGGSGTFTRFGITPSLSGSNTGLTGFGSGGQVGRYTDIGGTLGVVADTSTSIPGGSGTFTSFSGLSLSGSNTAFSGRGSGNQSGIYIDIGGTLGVLADTSAPIPGGSGTFSLLINPSLSGSNIAFTGAEFSGGQFGIYNDIGGTLGLVADVTTPIPGGSGTFTNFGVTPSLSGSNTALTGSGSGGQRGIYTDIGGTLGVVADTSTPIPGGSGTFTRVGLPSLSGSNTAFNGSGDGRQFGIYVDIGGSLMKVIDLADMLDGKSLSNLGNSRGFSGDSLAFQAIFLDQSQGIFRADAITSVPEPAVGLLIGLGLVGLGWARRSARAMTHA